jgi:hypothetical protein
MKEKLLKVFDKAADKTAAQKPTSINVFFSHDSYYYNLIPLKRSEKAAVAARDNDFQLDGFLIFPLSAVEDIRSKGRKYNEIMRAEGVCNDLAIPDIDISSMKKVCRHFEKSGEYISVETDNSYYIGRITAVSGRHIFFEWFDAYGRLYEPVKIRTDDIRLITYRSRYVEVFSKHIEKR